MAEIKTSESLRRKDVGPLVGSLVNLNGFDPKVAEILMSFREVLTFEPKTRNQTGQKPADKKGEIKKGLSKENWERILSMLETHTESLLNYFYRLINQYKRKGNGQIPDAADFLQDLMLRAVNTFERNPELVIENEEGWLFGIARHLYIDWVRRELTLKRGGGIHHEPINRDLIVALRDHNPEEIVISDEALEIALSNVRRNYAEWFLLYLLRGHPIEEIAIAYSQDPVLIEMVCRDLSRSLRIVLGIAEDETTLNEVG